MTVDWTTNSYTASAGSDFHSDGGTLRFEAGQTLKVVRVELIDSSGAEGIERFFVGLSNASGGTLHVGAGQVTVIDNDSPAATPGLYVRDVSIDEKQGTATFLVTLGENVGQNSSSTVTVDFATVSNSAVAGQRLHRHQRHAELRGR